MAAYGYGQTHSSIDPKASIFGQQNHPLLFIAVPAGFYPLKSHPEAREKAAVGIF